MFYPLPLFVGLRYVRTRRQGFFVSFISWVSMLGVCIGVMALIVVLSIMNGMAGEMRARLLSLASHATVSGPSIKLRDWRTLQSQIGKAEGVVGVAPFVEVQAMVGRGTQLTGAIVRGVIPEEESKVTEFGRHMKVGSFDQLQPGSQSIVLGAGLAWNLDARVGDPLTVMILQDAKRSQTGQAQEEDGLGIGIDLQPKIQTFTVTGIFEVAAQEHDNVLALINMEDGADFLGTDGAPTGLRLKFADIFSAPSSAPKIAATLGSPGEFTSRDWSQEFSSYFRAIKIEKTMMTLILALIVAVAAFNIVAALVMVVNEKRTDIAILRTVGVSPRSVIGIFVTQGVVIGWLGAFLGVGLGLTVALNIDVIVPFIENLFGMHFFDPEVYYIVQIPSEVQWPQVAVVAILALLLTVAATLYPALRGARTEPADALRYE